LDSENEKPDDMNIINDLADNDGARPSRRPLGHEIRSVTHGLLGYLAVFTAEVKDRLSPEEGELLMRINHYAERVSDLVLILMSEKNDQEEH
jgi:hypothetical protein